MGMLAGFAGIARVRRRWAMADKEQDKERAKQLTTAAGIPVDDNQTSLTSGERGPTLL